jgi:uncharacterized membrane protein YfcA
LAFAREILKMEISGLWWILGLFLLTLAIGIIAPVAGLGGGVLWVPVVIAFFPFHVDFVRGTGLVMAVTSALSSAPQFTKRGLANLKLMAPVVAVSTATATIGGMVGLWITRTLPSGEHYITVALGVIVIIALLAMLTSKGSAFPEVKKVDALSQKLDISGAWYEPSLSRVVKYRVTNTPLALLAFAAVGLIAGMFGVGSGWANVVVLNLVMLAPIKVATSTSMLIISMNDAAATWVYLARGAVLPIIVIPTTVAMTIGARIGAKIAVRARPSSVRYTVMAIMFAAAVLDIIKGLSGLDLIPKIFG